MLRIGVRPYAAAFVNLVHAAAVRHALLTGDACLPITDVPSVRAPHRERKASQSMTSDSPPVSVPTARQATESSDKRKRRSERRNEVMRTMIIAAALELLADPGNRARTMEEIAEQADVSTASLYKYFASRTELYDMLVDRVLKTDEEYLARAFDSSKAPVEELSDIGNAYLEFGLRYPGFFQLVAQPTIFGPLSQTQTARIAARISDLIDRVAAVIKRGKESPDIPEGQRFAKDLDERKTAEVLHGAWNGLLGLSVRDDGLERTGDGLRELAELATTILRRGMTSPPEQSPAAQP